MILHQSIPGGLEDRTASGDAVRMADYPKLGTLEYCSEMPGIDEMPVDGSQATHRLEPSTAEKGVS